MSHFEYIQHFQFRSEINYINCIGLYYLPSRAFRVYQPVYDDNLAPKIRLA